MDTSADYPPTNAPTVLADTGPCQLAPNEDGQSSTTANADLPRSTRFGNSSTNAQSSIPFWFDTSHLQSSEVGNCDGTHVPSTTMDTFTDYPTTSGGGRTDAGPPRSTVNTGFPHFTVQSVPVQTGHPQSDGVENGVPDRNHSVNLDNMATGPAISGSDGVENGVPDRNHSVNLDNMATGPAISGVPRIFFGCQNQPPVVFQGVDNPRKRPATDDHVTKVKVVEPDKAQLMRDQLVKDHVKDQLKEQQQRMTDSFNEERQKLSDSQQKLIDNLQKQLEKAKNDSEARRQKLEVEIAEHKKASKGLNVTINNQQADFSKAITKLRDQEKKSKDLEQIQTANTTIEGLNQTLKSHRNTSPSAPNQLAQLNDQITAAGNEIQALRQSFGNEKRTLVAEGEQRIISLQNEMNGLRNRAANDSAEQEKLRQKISRLNDLNNNMSMREKRLQAQQEQALSAAKKEYESQFSKLKTNYDTSLANVHAQLAQLKARLDSGRGRQNDLESSESQQVQIATSLRTALEQEQEKNKMGLNKRNGNSLHSSIWQRRNPSLPPSNQPPPTRPSMDEDEDNEDFTSTQRSTPGPEIRGHRIDPVFPPNNSASKPNTAPLLSDDDEDMYLEDISPEDQASIRTALRSPTPVSGNERYRVPDITLEDQASIRTALRSPTPVSGNERY
ncbi:hypothetical protein CVT25_004910 [Psilocybe cyanescens]|uniref:Uncharacterized protein n=1 Tax=Psilocybe cyanescens TaxID=93625 RepID=A0A409XU88_PSICY|nr:hypothetical protein CVT25_004910 [Psilocybe cyanescens]